MNSSEITWRDGAEDRMKSIFLSSDDRSSASDFLASHITDWPSRYHLGEFFLAFCFRIDSHSSEFK